MMGAFFTLALNGFREARRNRVTVVVVAFAVALLLSSSLVADTVVLTLDRVLIDMGLSSMSLLLSLLAIFLSCGMLSKEIERRTIFLVVSKPVSRPLFLVSRLAGNMLTLGVLLFVMGALFFLELFLFKTPLEGVQLVAMALLWVELLVLCSFGFLMSTFSSQLVSAVVTTGVFLAGHLSADIYKLGVRAKSEALQVLAKGIYYVLPNLERLNFRPRATYSLPVTAAEALASFGYGVAYAGVLIVLAIAVFNRRDFK